MCVCRGVSVSVCDLCCNFFMYMASIIWPFIIILLEEQKGLKF